MSSYEAAQWARGTAVAHSLHTGGVTGSIPVAPTIFPPGHIPPAPQTGRQTPRRQRAIERRWPPPRPSSSSATSPSPSAARRCSTARSLRSRRASASAWSGRNGSGKSTLLKIAAGLVEPDRGRALRAAGRDASATCRRSRTSPAMRRRSAYVEAGLGPSDDPHQARYLLRAAGAPATRIRRGCRAARRGARRWRACWRRRRTSCCSTSRPTISTCRPSSGWSGSWRAQRSALVLISHDRRFLENLSRTTVWLDRGTTRRVERGFGEFEAWRDEVLAEEEIAAAQARPQDRARGALAALRRHRAAQAQRRAAGELQALRAGAPHASAAPPATPTIAASEAEHVGQAGGRGEGHRQEPSATAPIVADFSIAHPARRPDRHRRAQRQRQDHAGQAC